MPTVFLKTYGCQMNERDSEAVAAQLVARGYALAESEAGADVVLINTCSVRDLAEQKALGKMGYLIGQARKENRKQIYGFLGCMSQSRGSELTQRVPGVRLVVGTQRFHRTGEYLEEILSGRRESVVEVGEEEGSQSAIREHLPSNGSGAGVKAFVSIMQGCNQHCTFCIVPQTRGDERSRSILEIVEECRGLVERGVREVTLLGQIVTSYGKRLYPVINGLSPFVQLLEAVHAVEGLERIRFTSPHPKGYGDDLIEAYGRLPKLVESAHLPLQSGSDSILRRMHRGYTRARYLEIVRKLRERVPGIGLSTDLIVGFPGETEGDFEETLRLCEEVEFDMAFAFKYSPRRETPAATMADRLPEAQIEERHQRLLGVVNACGRRRYSQWLGRTVEILVEGPSRKNAERYEGRTRCNKIVVFPGSDRHRGQLMEVEITEVGNFTLYGDPAMLGLREEESVGCS